MTRKCSNCGNNGHNSRTCSRNNLKNMDHQSGEGLRLFGVQLQVIGATNPSRNLNKIFSVESLVTPSQSVSANSSCSPSVSSSSSLLSVDHEVPERFPNYDYLSDHGLVCRTQEKKKGVPWSEEEHRRFLVGLEKLGKGDWRGISRHFVVTRSPTQVASHAQKYFLRQTVMKHKKCRSSLFDSVEAPSHIINQSPRIRHDPSLSNYVNFMSCYNPMSLNVVPSVSFEKSSPLTPKPQLHNNEKTPNLELSIAPSKYT